MSFMEFGNLVQDVVSSHGTDADQRVQERRAKLYRQTPNKNMLDTPLTKMVMSNLGAAKEAPEFKWSMQSHDPRFVQVSAGGAHKADTLNSAVGETEQLAADASVYLKMNANSARQVLKFEEVMLTLLADSDTHADHGASLHGEVASRVINGDNSYVQVKLFNKDTGGGGANGNILGQFNQGSARLVVSPIAPAMPEGSKLPWTRFREPTEKENYIQTFMAGLGLTGEELSNAQIFTESTYKRYWLQLWKQFNTYIERSILFGTKRKATVDDNLTGEIQTLSQYRMGGLLWMLKDSNFGNGANVFDVRKVGSFMDTNFTSSTWDTGAYDFLKLLLIKLSNFSSGRKKMYTSAVAKQEIINLFERMAHVTVDTKHKDAWGFEVTRIDGLNCSLEIAQHTDFSNNPALERDAIIVEPELISGVHKKGRGLAVIKSVKEMKSRQVEDGFGWRDAIHEGIFTTLGLEVDNLDAMCYVKNLGYDFAS